MTQLEIYYQNIDRLRQAADGLEARIAKILVADKEVVNQHRRTDDAPEFGSKEWFESIEPIPF